MTKQDKQQATFYTLNIILSIFGFFSFIMLIMMTGFVLSDNVIDILTIFIKIQIGFFISQEIYRIIIVEEKTAFIKKRYVEIILALLFLVYLLLPEQVTNIFKMIVPSLRENDLGIIYLIVAQLPFLLVIIKKLLKYSQRLGRIQLHSGAIFTISFALIILFGSFLLVLPKSVPTGHEQMKYVDALFTSTSAVCVTGLVVVDTAKDFSTQGQIFIVSLIQVGGLGVLTLTALFAMFANGGISFQIRVIMGDVLSDDNLSDVTQMIKRIILYTAFIELFCAMVMYFSLGGSILQPDGVLIYTSMFHSVSAFCNAGFSTFEGNLMNPIVQNNYLFVSFIMILIVLGGIGFPVIQNIVHLKPFQRHQKRIRYQLTITTKLALITTGILIFLPAIIIYFVEQMPYLPGASEFNKFFHALFISVTTRTAGFNTTPIEMMKGPAVLITLILMAIGASPASTGGGVKTTTFAIVFMQFIRLLKGQERLIIFNREIHREIVRKALLIMFTYAMCAFAGTLIISVIDPQFSIVDISYDVVSALSTVGLSRNLTPSLSDASKIVLILCMFIGRISVLTFFMAFHRPKLEPNFKLPKTNVMIG